MEDLRKNGATERLPINGLNEENLAFIRKQSQEFHSEAQPFINTVKGVNYFLKNNIAPPSVPSEEFPSAFSLQANLNQPVTALPEGALEDTYERVNLATTDYAFYAANVDCNPIWQVPLDFHNSFILENKIFALIKENNLLHVGVGWVDIGSTFAYDTTSNKTYQTIDVAEFFSLKQDQQVLLGTMLAALFIRN